MRSLLPTRWTPGPRLAFLAGRGLLLALCALLAWQAARAWTDAQLAEEVAAGTARAARQAEGVARDVTRSLTYYHGIPVVLAEAHTLIEETARVTAAGAELSPASRPTLLADPALRQLNTFLASVSRNLGADLVWLMDPRGTCFASSNAEAPDSLVGESFFSRDYFALAREGKRGSQYAVGKRTNVAGLYFSAPVQEQGRLLGVLAVKIGVAKLRSWVDQSEAFVADAFGVVLLASDPSLELRLAPGARAADLKDPEQLERYRRSDLAPLRLAAWSGGFPSLLRLEDQPEPVALEVRHLPEQGMSVYAVARFPAVAGRDRQVATRSLLLWAAALLLLVAVEVGRAWLRKDRQTQRMLAEQKARLDEAQRIARLGSWVWDIASGRMEWSDEARRIYAPEGGALAPDYASFLDAVHPEDQRAVQDAIHEALEGVRPYRIDHRLKGEGERVVSAQGEVQRSPSGKAVRMLGTVQDITDRKRIEAELQRARDAAEGASRAKSAFLANMSHEIRTPMNGVLGLTELLARTTLTPEQRDYVDSVARCGESLLTILNDVLDLSKIEAGKLEFEAIPFDLGALVYDVVELHRSKVGDKPVELLVDLDEELPARLVGDPSRLRQVLGNLVSNAVKFTAAGHVLVSTSLQGRGDGTAKLLVSVADTGIGIAPEAQGRLFEPFSQADASTSRRFGGSGLGLVLCRRIVEGMSGVISLRSAEGQGSTFLVYLELPVAKEAAPAPPKPEILRQARVLVVDEVRLNRTILRRQLARAGAAVEEAASPAEALDRAAGALREGKPFDAVLAGLRLPGAEAARLGAALRADDRLAATGLLALSSSGQRGEVAAVEAAGFDGYLVKPAREETLLKAAALVLERKRGGKAGAIVTRHTVAEAGPDPDDEGARLGPLRVLLAEDNAVNQKVARKMLEDLGATLEVAADGFQALEALGRGSFDAVLMDCQMPGLDGFAATARIREGERARGGHVPVIAMTANALAGDREQCLAAGMDDYVSKPITRRALWEALARQVPHAAAGPAPTGPAPATGGPADAPAAPPAGEPGLDAERFKMMEELFAGEDGGFYQGVLGPFVAITGQQVVELQAALAKDDAQAARSLSHSLKGAARNLGFAALGGLADALEQQAARCAIEEPSAQAAAIVAEHARVVRFTERYHPAPRTSGPPAAAPTS